MWESKHTPNKNPKNIYNGPMSRKGVTNNIILQYCSISDQKWNDCSHAYGLQLCALKPMWEQQKKIAVCPNRNIIKINIYVSSENKVCWSFAFMFVYNIWLVLFYTSFLFFCNAYQQPSSPSHTIRGIWSVDFKKKNDIIHIHFVETVKTSDCYTLTCVMPSVLTIFREY